MKDKIISLKDKLLSIDRNKLLLVIVILLCITCLSMGLCAFGVSIKENDKKNEDTSFGLTNNVSDFDNIDYGYSFEVSDFSGTKINTIDIKSKRYTPNTITVLDSDFKISEKTLNEMYGIINSYGASSSFMIISLDDGMTIGYNVDKKYQTASSIKAPYALSLSREIAKGNIDPHQKLTYEARHFSIGTGVIKNNDFGTQYTVDELIKYSLHESDNVAHQMLHNYFGVKVHNQHMKNLGANELSLSQSSPWGFITPRSGALVWQDIYNFAIEYTEGIKFMNILANGKYNYFKEVMPTIPSASKTGFAAYDVVETGIVFDDKPYIAVIIANKGGNIGAYTQVLKMISSVNNIMNEYKLYCEK